jgi:adenylate kinase family enzyme
MAEQPPQRIAVIGCSGAGKSTLARPLAFATGLPLVHLDAEHWQPGWVEPDEREWEKRCAAMIAERRWIIDGHYGSTLEPRLRRAELVIWLDLPTGACLWGAIRRWVAYRGRVRPDMGVDCPEKFDLEFLRWILGFRRNVRPRIVHALARSAVPVIHLRSSAERAALLSEVTAGRWRDALRPSAQGIARLASSRIEMP